jgi:hypothetical protein
LDRATRKSLAPGPQLDYQNQRAAITLNRFLSDITSADSTKEENEVLFYTWTRHIITIAASNGVYGDRNPFLDPSVEDAFWYSYLGQSLYDQLR